MAYRLIATLLMLSLPSLAVAANTLRLATTTSTADSGLLDTLLPAFEQISGQRIEVFAVGSGAALRMGRQGRADVLMVHAPEAELQFLANGHGVARHHVMHNDSLIVGPPADPAGVSDARNTVEALTRIWEHRPHFLSRGDDSGTHKKELSLWRVARLDPYGARWYRDVGASMASTLLHASEQGAYTLTDRGSWLALKDRLSLEVVFEGDPLLQNSYSVIAVNPDRHRGTNAASAQAFIDWLRTSPAQRLIRDFRKNGEALYTPVQDAE